jgi:hypothetical protein
MKKLEKQSKEFPDRYPTEKYLGDGWEFFCEALIKTHQYDNRIGISNYRPVIDNDNGVDGYGTNIYGKLCATQHKYRSNTDSSLTSGFDKLDSFIVESMLSNNIILNKEYRHYIFTTAKGLHHYTNHEKFKDKVKCFGYKDISCFVDKNINFWNFIRNEVDKFNQKIKNNENTV